MVNPDELEKEDEKLKDRITASALSWMRILLPIILGALGWYIGQVIGPMEKRITSLETYQQQSVVYRSKDETLMATYLRRIIVLEDDHRRCREDCISKEEFNRRQQAVEHDIEKLENRVYKHE